MGTILGALADLGYGVAYRVLDSQNFGVPQRRRRVFIVGHLGDDRAGEVLALSEGVRWCLATSGEAREDTPADAEGSAGDEDRGAAGRTVGALCARDFKGVGSQYVSEGKVITEADLGRSAIGLDEEQNAVVDGYGTLQARKDGGGFEGAVAISENQRAEVLETDTAPTLKTSGGKPGQGYSAARIGSVIRRLTPKECERLMSWPDSWTRYGLLPDGNTKEVSDSARYKACGNGVVSAVVRAVAERIT